MHDDLTVGWVNINLLFMYWFIYRLDGRTINRHASFAGGR